MGDLIEIIPPTAARAEARYRIRRTITVVVNGFHRNEYWATREQLTLVARGVPAEHVMTDHGLCRVPLADHDQERFEAQR